MLSGLKCPPFDAADSRCPGYSTAPPSGRRRVGVRGRVTVAYHDARRRRRSGAGAIQPGDVGQRGRGGGRVCLFDRLRRLTGECRHDGDAGEHHQRRAECVGPAERDDLGHGDVFLGQSWGAKPRMVLRDGIGADGGALDAGRHVHGRLVGGLLRFLPGVIHGQRVDERFHVGSDANRCRSRQR